MTPRWMNAAHGICQSINLITREDGVNLYIYRATGELLRTFLIYRRDGHPYINSEDFDKWWQFMGFNK